jgi:hypothetical protein
MISPINNFSPHLFWDVEKNDLDLVKHRKFIVQRVLGHGRMNDWKLLKQCYTMEQIVSVAQSFRCLDPKTLAFIACVGNVSKESFRCYAAVQSAPTHWIP